MTRTEKEQRAILRALRRARLVDWLGLLAIAGTIVCLATLFALFQD